MGTLSVLITFVAFCVFLALWIYVIIDVIRRPGIGRGRKAAWILFALFLPILFAVVYAIANARRLADRFGLGPGSQPEPVEPEAEPGTRSIELVGPRDLVVADSAPPHEDVQSLGRNGTPETKACPDCAETVLAAAKVCRHCGYRFDEATPG